MFHAFAILVDGSIRITVTASHDAVIVSLQVIVAVAGWVVAVVFKSTVSTVSHWVIVVRSVRQSSIAQLVVCACSIDSHTTTAVLAGQFQLP